METDPADLDRTGPGTVVLDIGADVGALIIEAPASMTRLEIEVSPQGPGAARVHAVVRPRNAGTAVWHAAVFPALPAGLYTVWREDGSSAGTVRVPGGCCATFPIGKGRRAADGASPGTGGLTPGTA